MKKISVVILKYDESQDIAGTFQDTFNDEWEYIIADATGGADAGTINILNSFAAGKDNVLYIDLSDREFQNVARLKCAVFPYVSGEYICTVNAGEKVAAKALSELLSLEKNNVCKDNMEMFNRLLLEGDANVSHYLINKESVKAAGLWNEGLGAGEDYELMLRVLAEYGAGAVCAFTTQPVKPVFQENYYTYAYVLGRYIDRLKAADLFDEAFTARYNEAAGYGIADYFVKNAESMISKSKEFKTLQKKTAPVLMITGELECNGALASFADGLADALKGQGIPVVVKNVNTEEPCREDAAKTYRAVIGFQSGMFTKQTDEGELFGNLFDCPKFNFIFDHPLYVSYHLMLPVKDYYILHQDESCVDFIKGYYPYVAGAWHFSPAGIKGRLMENELMESDRWESRLGSCLKNQEKSIDVSFVAMYNDYRQRLAAIEALPEDLRKTGMAFFEEMKIHPNQTAQEALRQVLEDMGEAQYSKKDFVIKLNKLMDATRAVAFFYREKVVKCLLDGGITVDVYGKCWENSPFAKSPYLRIHPDIEYTKGLDVMAESRISLNVMTWHKGGMTERVANAMQNGAVCVTDRTTYIDSNFEDGKNIVIFDLEDINALPEKIKSVLENDDLRLAIAQEAFKKSQNEHCWDSRAVRFVDILREVENK